MKALNSLYHAHRDLENPIDILEHSPVHLVSVVVDAPTDPVRQGAHELRPRMRFPDEGSPHKGSSVIMACSQETMPLQGE
jgi:hypothetical protein